nr:DsbA family protein [Phaeovibrio sulfidiphilus]
MFFYFDFNCPYSWVAAERIMDIAGRHTRDVRWRAIPSEMLCHESAPWGFPPGRVPGVEQYIQRDLGRLLRMNGLEYARPVPLSKGASIAPSCGFHWIREEKGREASRAYALAVFRARFQLGSEVADPDVAADIAVACGHGRGEFLDAISDPVWQGRLTEEVNAARKDGVIATPFINVDGEPFWAVEGLDIVDAWLARGGW